MLYKYTLLLLSSLLLATEIETNSTKIEKNDNLKIVPLLSSNPTSGTGVGAAITYLYSTDPDSSPSQFFSGAQYTNTKSWSAFIQNEAYLYSNKLRSSTILARIHNKTQFDIPANSNFDMGTLDMIPNAKDGVKYNIDLNIIAQMFMYEIKEHLYVGGLAYYVSQDFSDTNALGDIFLQANGASDAKRGTVGLSFAYDTRGKNEKFFPRNAEWIALQVEFSPTAFGANTNYSTARLNARIYRPGFNKEDVWANQFYSFYSGKRTPDGALGALGTRKILRGFAIGKYKARFLNSFQTEYRYQVPQSKYRLVAFAGIADLQGGSIGDSTGNNRDRDNGIYYSAGAGLRYAIQKEAGVDVYLDVAINDDKETSVYVGINQAF